MDNLPKTWDDWIENFKAWQDNVGYDREWMGILTSPSSLIGSALETLLNSVTTLDEPSGSAPTSAPPEHARRTGQHDHRSGRHRIRLRRTAAPSPATAPTDYDRYAAARIMAEEQRHGWQMAYLLMTYFGQQGRREAQKLLERNAQDGDRLLGAFNRPMPHWLDFFCYTMFVDRDGKFQLGMLSTSAFKPLAASMGPMLKEESFHLGTGSNGLRRIIKAG